MMKAPRRRPSLEVLEPRTLLAVTGVAWPDPGHLTLSFAPDGTSVANFAPSALFQTLNARYTPNTWQATLLRAVQSWAVLGNINVGLVSDSGQPAGQAGPLQGNTGAGDLRVFATPLSSNEAATAAPFDLLGGGLSGSVVLNSNAPFGNGTGGTEDLLSVALHEFGHTLGLGDNQSDPSSALYDIDLGGHTAPSAADAAALQALYGVRAADSRGNGTLANASALGYVSASHTATYAKPPTSLESGLSAAGDHDLFAVTVPAGAGGPFSVSLHAQGVSLLTARLTVYNALGVVMGSAATTDPTHNNLTVTIPSCIAGATYYAMVTAGQTGVFGIGSYRIAAGDPSLAPTAAATPTPAPVVTANANTRLATVTDLTPNAPTNDARWQALARQSLLAPTEADYFAITTRKTGTATLVATVWETQHGGLAPRVDVFDAKGNPVASQLLSQDAASASVEVPGAAANTRYVVRVSAQDPTSTHAVGGYVLGLNSLATPITPPTFANGTLNDAQSQDFRNLTVTGTQVIHLDLALTGSGTAGDTGAKVTVYDANDQPVYSLKTLSNAPATSGDVILKAGTYFLRIVAGTKSGAPLSASNYTLRGLVRSDPIGPSPVDTTLNPVSTGPVTPPTDPVITLNPILYYAYLASLGGPGSSGF